MYQVNESPNLCASTPEKDSAVQQMVDSTLKIVLDPTFPKTPDYVDGWQAVKGVESLSLMKSVTIT